jgi:hypothetical protein
LWINKCLNGVALCQSMAGVPSASHPARTKKEGRLQPCGKRL